MNLQVDEHFLSAPLEAEPERAVDLLVARLAQRVHVGSLSGIYLGHKGVSAL